MSITSILRNFDGDPNIVTIVSTNTLAEITTTGYLTSAAIVADIESLQNGEFQWADTDLILIYYSPAQIGFFVRDAVNNTFDALAPSGGLADTLQNGDIFVGNAGNVATGVVPSGDITLSNTGVFGIAAGVIVNADINASAGIAYSKLAALPSGDILVGSAGNVATAVAVTGDVVISNAGVTAISAGVIVNTDINAGAAIDFSKLATLTSGNILVGSAGNAATSVTMSGDATIIASGALTIANGAVTSAKTAITLLKYVAVAITAAEFNGMYDAPKLILAAGGANTFISVERAVLAMTFVSAAYAAGGIVGFQYDSTVHGAGVAASNTEAAADFFAAASTAFSFTGVSGNTVAIAPFTTSVNKGIYLSNLTQAFTTGDGTWICHLWYRVIPTV
jgi:hypothetical protein